MKYISVLEYLQGRIAPEDLNIEQMANMNTLIPKVNELLEKFGEYRAVTSGFRHTQDQIRIYKAKGITDLSKIPMGSAHLKAAAVDLADSDGKLDDFCLNNLKLLKELGLYLESPTYTKGWCHLQIIKPKSGNNPFNP